jgi:Metal binding domain of Ada/PGF-CTERM motif
MRADKVVSFSVVILIITALLAASVTVPAALQPAAAQSTKVQSYAGSFVGSKNSNVYHYPSCTSAATIKSSNLVTFATVEDACARGYRPCKVCNPPACPTATPTATAKPTAAAPTATPTATAKPTAAATPTSKEASPSTANVAQASSAKSSSNSTPGFEALFALGALAAVFLALWVTRRS